jgi:microbial collagenase
MKLVLLSVVFAINVLFPEASASRPPPPRTPRQFRNSIVDHPEIIKEDALPRMPAEPADLVAPVTKRADCGDLQGIIAATGDDLVQKVLTTADPKCLYGLFSLTGSDAQQAFNYADMKALAYEFYSGAYYYDPKNPETGSLLQLILYLRAGLYVSYYHKDDTGSYEDDLNAYVEQGLRYLFGKEHMDATSDRHYDTFTEATTLVTNAELSLKLAEVCAELLDRISTWSWTLAEFGQGSVVNGLFNIFWRITFEKGADEAMATKMSVPKALDNFMNVRANLLSSKGEWLLANAGGELSRALQYASIKSQVSPLVQAQVKKYSLTNGARIWIAIASSIDHFDKENCAQYGTCNFTETAKAALFPYSKVCQITKTDQFTVKAQKITPEQLDIVCNRLKAHEKYFHDRLATNWQPVKDDYNWQLNVVIYQSDDDYKAFNYALYGYDTNNGGIYIEGNPAYRNNVGHFFCFIQNTWGGDFDVWNLEHEITHYFDGRYNAYGDFAMESRYPTVWWSEGLGEYMAHKNDYSALSSTCTEKKYPLSSIFQTTYDQGQEKVYYYGYAAVRFMFEHHRPNVDQILLHQRDGKFDKFTSYVKDTLGTQYDGEFSKWCDCIAAGKPC